MFQGNIGDNSSACPSFVSLAIPSGQTVTVTNVAGSTINYYNDAEDSSVAGTIAASGSQAFTTPTWIASQGISSVQITGAGY